jgi:hypothetical protein
VGEEYIEKISHPVYQAVSVGQTFLLYPQSPINLKKNHLREAVFGCLGDYIENSR